MADPPQQVSPLGGIIGLIPLAIGAGLLIKTTQLLLPPEKKSSSESSSESSSLSSLYDIKTKKVFEIL